MKLCSEPGWWTRKEQRAASVPQDKPSRGCLVLSPWLQLIAAKQKHPQLPMARGSWGLQQAFLRAVDPKNTKSLTQYARNPGRAFLKKAVGVGMFSNQAHEAQQKCFSLSAHWCRCHSVQGFCRDCRQGWKERAAEEQTLVTGWASGSKETATKHTEEPVGLKEWRI